MKLYDEMKSELIGGQLRVDERHVRKLGNTYCLVCGKKTGAMDMITSAMVCSKECQVSLDQKCVAAGYSKER